MQAVLQLTSLQQVPQIQRRQAVSWLRNGGWPGSRGRERKRSAGSKRSRRGTLAALYVNGGKEPWSTKGVCICVTDWQKRRWLVAKQKRELGEKKRLNGRQRKKEGRRRRRRRWRKRDFRKKEKRQRDFRNR